MRDCTIYEAKTKALISFAVTAKLICVFVFAYAKSRFSHNEAHMSFTHAPIDSQELYIGLFSNFEGTMPLTHNDKMKLTAIQMQCSVSK